MRAFDACELEVEALEPMREPLVIHAQQMQGRGVKVANVHRILHRVVAEVVGAAITEAGLDPCSRHPNRKATWVMISTGLWRIPFALPRNSPTKFATPNHKRIPQQAPLL